MNLEVFETEDSQLSELEGYTHRGSLHKCNALSSFLVDKYLGKKPSAAELEKLIKEYLPKENWNPPGTYLSLLIQCFNNLGEKASNFKEVSYPKHKQTPSKSFDQVSKRRLEGDSSTSRHKSPRQSYSQTAPSLNQGTDNTHHESQGSQNICHDIASNSESSSSQFLFDYRMEGTREYWPSDPEWNFNLFDQFDQFNQVDGLFRTPSPRFKG